MLELDLRQRQGHFQLDMQLAIPVSGVTALFGRSGSGKSSLIRLMAGLARPERGYVRLAGETLVDTRHDCFVPPHRRRLGVVFQEARLFPHYTVRGNLRYGMPREARGDLAGIIDLLGIGHLLERTPGRLSGGEARRVAIGRALLTRPRMLLLDEPLTGLDGERKQELLRYIARLAREVKIPILYVSHDTREIRAVAQRLVRVEAGRVQGWGEVDAMLGHLGDEADAGQDDTVSWLRARIESHDDTCGLTRLALGDAAGALRLEMARLETVPGEWVALPLSAQHVGVVVPGTACPPDTQCLAATLLTLEPASRPPYVELLLEVAGQRLRAWHTRKAVAEMGLVPGQALTVGVRSMAIAPRSVRPVRACGVAENAG